MKEREQLAVMVAASAEVMQKPRPPLARDWSLIFLLFMELV